MKRRWEIDAVRGLMLVLMTLTHLPTRLTSPTGQPFGFVSAAEGFVLLSAFMAGMVYSRLAYKGSVDAMRKAFWRRALKVYLCQAAMLLFLFTVIAALGGRIDEPDVSNLMSFYLREPVTAFLAGLALIYEPALLDILPLYVLFMLVSPWILAWALKHRWRYVLIASCSLWLLSQFDLSMWLYRTADLFVDIPVPYGETGSFNTLSWQLIWVVGLWLGARSARPGVTPLNIPKWIVWPSIFVAIYGLVWRHYSGQAGFGADESLNMLLDKWRLGPLRLLDLTALVIVVMTYGTTWAAKLPRIRVLETLGAASLPVFCTHLVVVLLVLAILGGNPLEHPWWVDAIVLAACFSALYIAAKITLWFDEGPAIKDAMESLPAIDLPTPVDAEPIESGLSPLMPTQPFSVAVQSAHPTEPALQLSSATSMATEPPSQPPR